LIAASTGSAAANLELGASTLHSLAMIPVDRQKSVIENPSAKCLQEMQNRFKNVKLLIIDEFCMIGKNLMGKLDIRLRQATGKESLMGGLNILFCRDPQQLPPVGDTVLYQPASGNDSSLKMRGSCIYDVMTRSPIILDEVMRQADEILVKLLSNCASGKLTKEDWKLLQSRNPDRVPGVENDFKDAVRLFQDKDSVCKYNSAKISNLGSPIARVQAEHNCKEAEKA
jgi:ATP-dependent exoDNAse (exonuclease V) alpha subunit